MGFASDIQLICTADGVLPEDITQEEALALLDEAEDRAKINMELLELLCVYIHTQCSAGAV